MKNILLCYIITLISSTVIAQTINCQWSEFSSGSWNNLTALDIDSENNVFIAGNYQEMMLGTYSLSAQGSNADSKAFAAKLNAGGEIEWLNEYGDVGFTDCKFVKCDNTDNLLIALEFTDSINVHGLSYVSEGSFDVVILKLNNDGQLIWSRHIKSQNSLTVATVDLLKSDKILIFVEQPWNDDTVFFDHLSSKGYRILASYDREGNVMWTKELTGWNFSNLSIPLVSTQNGHIYYTGAFSDSITFADTTIMAAGYWSSYSGEDSIFHPTNDFFLAKMDSLGREVWVTTVAAEGHEQGEFLTVHDSALFVVGTYSDSSFLGLQSESWPGGTFLLKYDTSGLLLNKKSIASNLLMGVSELIIGDISCGDEDVLLTGQSLNGVFLEKYDLELNLLKSFHAEGVYYGMGNSVEYDNNNEILLGGRFIEEVAFGDCVVSGVGPNYNVFLVKLNGDFVLVNKEPKYGRLVIYPNPVRDNLTVKLQNVIGDLKLRVIDVNGRIVLEGTHTKIETPEITIDVSSLISGVYIVEIVIGNEKIVERMVKK